RYYMVHGNWDPSARGFKELIHLNEETPKGIVKMLSIFRLVYVVPKLNFNR
ncbi:unnamed protein product, partial [Rotaria magnacalcarata]